MISPDILQGKRLAWLHRPKWSDYQGCILRDWRTGCWDFFLNSWHSVGQNGDFSFIVLSLSVFLLSRSHLMVSTDSDIRGRLTVDILLLFTIHPIPFFPSDQEAELSGEQEGGGMGVTWHAGSCCTLSYLWFQGKSKAGRATDRCVVALCFCVDNDGHYRGYASVLSSLQGFAVCFSAFSAYFLFIKVRVDMKLWQRQGPLYHLLCLSLRMEVSLMFVLSF